MLLMYKESFLKLLIAISSSSEYDSSMFLTVSSVGTGSGRAVRLGSILRTTGLASGST